MLRRSLPHEGDGPRRPAALPKHSPIDPNILSMHTQPFLSVHPPFAVGTLRQFIVLKFP